MEGSRQERCRDTVNESRMENVNCSEEFVANPIAANSRGLLLPGRDRLIEADVVLNHI